MKLASLETPTGRRYVFYCPACERDHEFSVRDDGGGASFDGDRQYPTFWPPLKTGKHPNLCSLQLKDGIIRYYAESDHAMAGKSVELPDMGERWGAP